MDVQLRQLRTLVAVVDAGTFTDAAALLGITQASVSRSIAALETTLGARILERTTRHVSVTAVGAKVVDQARRVLAEVGHLQQIVDRAHTEIRVGYAWAALGRHTRRLQKTWARTRPDVPLLFVHANDPTAGLSDGRADVAVIRRPLADPRFRTAPVGLEARYAAVATDHTLARRRSLRLADLARYTVAIDTRTGTTTPDLWPAGTAPTSTRATSSMEDWLTQIALGQVVGITSEATAHQNPRPGVAYRAVRDAPPIEVSMAWWANNPPARLEELLALAREVFRGATAEVVAATWICVRDGRLLVVRPAGQEAFFLPGGKPEPGETPVEAAVREVREETGIRLRPEQLTHFAEIIRPAYGRRDTNVHLICFTGPGHGTAEPAGEIAEVAWFTAADAPRCAPAIQEIITRLTRQNLLP